MSIAEQPTAVRHMVRFVPDERVESVCGEAGGVILMTPREVTCVECVSVMSHLAGEVREALVDSLSEEYREARRVDDE